MTAILMVLTNHDELGNTGRRTGWFLSEAAHPWRVFTDAGFDTSWVSPEGGFATMDGADLTDPIQQQFLDEFGKNGPETQAATSLDPTRFDAVFFVGGHGAMWDFPNNEYLATISMSIYGRNGVIAAVCHGPAGLVNLTFPDGRHLVAGKNLASFTDSEEEAVGLSNVVPFLLSSELAKRGAILHAAPNFAANTVTDGRIVTGQNPASATGTAEAVVIALKTARATMPSATSAVTPTTASAKEPSINY
jgi:putative intracellular protease/amidase